MSFCRFLYSDEVQIGPETVMTTLYTAKKYAVPALEAHCVEFLKKNLRADNAFMLLTQVSSACKSILQDWLVKSYQMFYTSFEFVNLFILTVFNSSCFKISVKVSDLFMSCHC